MGLKMCLQKEIRPVPDTRHIRHSSTFLPSSAPTCSEMNLTTIPWTIHPNLTEALAETDTFLSENWPKKTPSSQNKTATLKQKTKGSVQSRKESQSAIFIWGLSWLILPKSVDRLPLTALKTTTSSSSPLDLKTLAKILLISARRAFSGLTTLRKRVQESEK